jgi:hypothetical protein
VIQKKLQDNVDRQRQSRVVDHNDEKYLASLVRPFSPPLRVRTQPC